MDTQAAPTDTSSKSKSPVNITKTVSIYPVQKAFLQSKAIFKAFVGGIGSGKSWVGAYDMIRRSKSGRLYLVCAPTYPMLEDASFRSVLSIAQYLELVQPKSIKRGAPPSIKLLNGAEIIFRSTDNPENLRGPNLSGIWLDEAGLMKVDAFDVLIGRLREGGEQGWMTLTFTPKGKAHWTYKKFGRGERTEHGCRDGNSELFHARTYDNPFLPPGFFETVRARYSAKQAEQELGGHFLDAGGNHFFPGGWPRYKDLGDAYRIVEPNGVGNVIHKNDCTTIICLDWAMGKKRKIQRRSGEKQSMEESGDFTAFVVCDLTNDGRLFIIDVVNKRLQLEENAPKLEELCDRYKPKIVVGEDDMLSETMILDTRRYRIPEIRRMEIAGRSKRMRAEAAIIRGENGRIYLPQSEPSWFEEYCDQLASFTGIESDDDHDDMVDATGIAGRLADELVCDGQLGYDDFPEVMIDAPQRI